MAIKTSKATKKNHGISSTTHQHNYTQWFFTKLKGKKYLYKQNKDTNVVVINKMTANQHVPTFSKILQYTYDCFKINSHTKAIVFNNKSRFSLNSDLKIRTANLRTNE